MGAALVRIGTDTDKRPAMACPHMAQWWPVYTRLVAAELGVELEIIQAAGTAAKSGKTHVQGCAIDLRTWRFAYRVVARLVRIAREMGARATWYRTRAQGFEPHIHLHIDCPCLSGGDYQLAAVDAGYNGLGPSGRGYRDDGPTPTARRDYAQGIAWAHTQEEDMALSDDDLRKVAVAVWSATFGAAGTAGQRLGRADEAATLAAAQTAAITRGGKGIALRQEVADAKTMLLGMTGQVAGLTAALGQLAAGQGVDPAQISAIVSQAVTEALKGAKITVDLGA